MLLFHDAFYVFNHNNRVVDHNTNGQYQTEQGQNVEREAEDQHESEGSDQ